MEIIGKWRNEEILGVKVGRIKIYSFSRPWLNFSCGVKCGERSETRALCFKSKHERRRYFKSEDLLIYELLREKQKNN